MAKVPDPTIPQEAVLIFAGITLHAIVSSGCTWSKKDIAKYALDLSEEVLREMKDRGLTQK